MIAACLVGRRMRSCARCAEANVVYVETCGAGRVPPMSAGERESGMCDPIKRRRFGCVKDTWALASRDAANVYFNRSLLELTRNDAMLNRARWFECRLGVALHSRNVTVRWRTLKRTICRTGRRCVT